MQRVEKVLPLHLVAHLFKGRNVSYPTDIFVFHQLTSSYDLI